MTVNTYAISIEFIGTRYRGWQRQQEVDSIQQHVEAALSKIANEPISHRCGSYWCRRPCVKYDCPFSDQCHASAFIIGCVPQILYYLMISRCAGYKWCPLSFMRAFLPIARRYRYITLNHPFRPAILNQQITSMNTPRQCPTDAAGSDLSGRHRMILPVFVPLPANLISLCAMSILPNWFSMVSYWYWISSRWFLHHMVRNIMGTLFEIGRGESQSHGLKHCYWAKLVTWWQQPLLPMGCTLSMRYIHPNFNHCYR